MSSFPALLLAYLSLFILGISDNIRGPLYPEILNDLHLTNSQGALFFSLSSLLGILGSFLAPWVIHRRGYKQTLMLSLVLTLVAQIGTAFITPYFAVLIFSATLGMGLGVMNVVQNVLVLAGSSPSRRQQLQAGLHSMYGISSLLAPVLVTFFYKHIAPSWRLPYLGAAAFTLSLLALCLMMKVRLPREDGFHLAKKKSLKWDRPHIYFGIMLGCYVMAEIMVSTRISLYVTREFHFAFERASLYAALFFIFLLIGRLLFVFWRPSISVRAQMLICLLLALVSGSLGLVAHPFFLTLTGLFMGPFYPLAMTLAAEEFHETLENASSVAVSISSILVVFMHSTVGALADAWGLQRALWIGPLFLGIATVLLFRKKEKPA